MCVPADVFLFLCLWAWENDTQMNREDGGRCACVLMCALCPRAYARVFDRRRDKNEKINIYQTVFLSCSLFVVDYSASNHD